MEQIITLLPGVSIALPVRVTLNRMVASGQPRAHEWMQLHREGVEIGAVQVSFDVMPDGNLEWYMRVELDGAHTPHRTSGRCEAFLASRIIGETAQVMYEDLLVWERITALYDAGMADYE